MRLLLAPADGMSLAQLARLMSCALLSFHGSNTLLFFLFCFVLFAYHFLFSLCTGWGEQTHGVLPRTVTHIEANH